MAWTGNAEQQCLTCCEVAGASAAAPRCTCRACSRCRAASTSCMPCSPRARTSCSTCEARVVAASPPPRWLEKRQVGFSLRKDLVPGVRAHLCEALSEVPQRAAVAVRRGPGGVVRGVQLRGQLAVGVVYLLQLLLGGRGCLLVLLRLQLLATATRVRPTPDAPLAPLRRPLHAAQHLNHVTRCAAPAPWRARGA